MKRLFQLVKAEDGTRTAVFVSTREQLAQLLTEGVQGVSIDDFVLHLGDVPEDKDFSFGQAPLLTVHTFCQHFGGLINAEVL